MKKIANKKFKNSDNSKEKIPLKNLLAKESKLVSKNSMKVLKDFEMLDDKSEF